MKKGFLYIISANLIGLVVSILTSFLLPKYLSVETYAAIKTYALYITFAGFFSLGYNDGMYLRYGGAEISNIGKNEFKKNISNYIYLELLMLSVVMFIGLFTKNILIVAFAFGMLATNVLGYLRSFYQALGEFKDYGNALNIEKILVFVFNLILLFIVESHGSLFYVVAQILVGFVTCAWLLYDLKKKNNYVIWGGKVSIKEIQENVQQGFILMLGNFSSIIFTGIDRWFVNFLLTVYDFAMYSFAVSMENIVNVFMTPITVSMYNFFCKKPTVQEIRKIKNWVLMWGFLIIGGAYPIKWIINLFLVKYNDSVNVIFYLFAAQTFYAIIKGIYVNIYKANKNQKLYLKQMTAMIVIGIILNFILFKLWHNMSAFALATLITSIVWMLICEVGNRELAFTWREYIFIVNMIFIYVITGSCTGAVIGCVIYYVLFIVLLITLMNSTFMSLISNFSSVFYKVLKKQ